MKEMKKEIDFFRFSREENLSGAPHHSVLIVIG
jgi:hypothetical protein